MKRNTLWSIIAICGGAAFAPGAAFSIAAQATSGNGAGRQRNRNRS